TLSVLRQILLALSLANLCFFTVWGAVLPGMPIQYYMNQPPSRQALVAVLCNVVLLAATFWMSAAIVSRGRGRKSQDLMNWSFVGFFLLALNSARRSLKTIPAAEILQLSGRPAVDVLAILIAAIGVYCAFRWRKGIFRAAETAVL